MIQLGDLVAKRVVDTAKDGSPGQPYWIMFEHGKLRHPLLVLPEWQVENFFSEVLRTIKENRVGQ